MMKNKSLSQFPILSFSLNRKKSHGDPINDDNELIKPRLDYTINVFVNRSAVIKTPGFLRVLEGEKVTILNFPEKGCMIDAQKENEFGKVPICVLDLQHHSWNIYLDALEIITKYPDILLTILDDPQFLNSELYLVPTLTAHRMLDFALKILFQHEFVEIKDNNELFRQKTPSVAFISALLNNSKNLELQRFRKSFVNFVISQINTDSNHMSIAAKAINYIIELSVETVPSELVIILKILKEVALNMKERNFNLPVLLGSLFFLRFLCPALSQPLEFCGIRISNEIRKTLVSVTKELQLISNQTNGENEKISSFLLKIADIKKFSLPKVDESLILHASVVYSALYKHKDSFDPAHFQPIVDKLGEPLQNIPNSEAEVPMYSTIIGIKKYIELHLESN